MSGKENFIKELINFFNTDTSVMLIQGKMQTKKHKVIIQYIGEEFAYKNVLFVIDSMTNVFNYTSINSKLKIGDQVKLGNNFYEFVTPTYIDKASDNVDYIIVFPIDAIAKNKKKMVALNNSLQEKGAEKIFYITANDNVDTTSLNDYVDIKFTYDQEN